MSAVEGGTRQDVIDRWRAQLRELLSEVERAAAMGGWTGTWGTTEIREDPFGLGAALEYLAPVLVLRRPHPQTGEEQRITFEPRHRYTMGAAGRIDVYSFPGLREALLLRVPDVAGAESLTWDEAEERVSKAPWKIFSPDRLPLNFDLSSPASLCAFLDALSDGVS